MSVNVDKLARDMANIVGKDMVFTDKPTIMVYAQGSEAYELEEQNLPYVVVRPSSAEEVSRILKKANQGLVPVHLHGSGTSLVGQARPKTKCILLDMGRMNRIEVFPERGYCEVGGGARVHEVRQVLSRYNAMLPMFPGSEPVATVGGMVAVNTSAHVVDAALGKPGDFVLGLEVVLPTGEIIETGTKSMRKPAGIELTKFFIGSEGLLGVLTTLRLRLVPSPSMTNIVAFYKTVDGVLDTVMETYKQGIFPPLFFEFMDEKTSKVGFKAVGLAEPPGCVALMAIHSWSKAGAEERANNFLRFLKVGNPVEARIVKDEKEWSKIWHSRAEGGQFRRRLTQGLTLGGEIAPRVDKLKEAYHEAEALTFKLESLKSYKDKEFWTLGHIGAPTIHPHVFIPTKLPQEVAKALWLEYRRRTEDINVKYEGCGGEWGITALRVPFLREKYGEIYYGLLKKLKKTVDPNNILNRGNLDGVI